MDRLIHAGYAGEGAVMATFDQVAAGLPAAVPLRAVT